MNQNKEVKIKNFHCSEHGYVKPEVTPSCPFCHKGVDKEYNYERDGSHSHCLNQKQPPACGQKLKNHKQCCLCDLPAPQNESEWEKEFDKQFVGLKSVGHKKIGNLYVAQAIKSFIKKIKKQPRQSTLAEITELVKGTNKEWEIILVKGYLGDFMEMIKRRNRFFGWDNRGIVDEAQKMTFKVIDKLTDTLLTKLKDK